MKSIFAKLFWCAVIGLILFIFFILAGPGINPGSEQRAKLQKAMHQIIYKLKTEFDAHQARGKDPSFRVPNIPTFDGIGGIEFRVYIEDGKLRADMRRTGHILRDWKNVFPKDYSSVLDIGTGWHIPREYIPFQLEIELSLKSKHVHRGGGRLIYENGEEKEYYQVSSTGNVEKVSSFDSGYETTIYMTSNRPPAKDVKVDFLSRYLNSGGTYSVFARVAIQDISTYVILRLDGDSVMSDGLKLAALKWPDGFKIAAGKDVEKKAMARLAEDMGILHLIRWD